MNKYIKVGLLVLITIGFLIISIVVVNFFINGHIHWFSEVDKDYFGIFGDFIGGVTGTIFTIVATILVWLTYNSQREELEATRNLLIKQLELSYKPDLFIKDTKIYIYGVIKNSILCPKYITNTHEYSKELHSYAFVELINVGGEISKRTNYSWDCDLKEIGQFFDDNFSDTYFKISFPNQNRSIKYKSLNGSSTLGPLNMISLKQTTDFVLPYKINEKVVKIQIPDSYIEWLISSIILEEKEKKTVFNDLFKPVEFPKLFLNISYEDILGKIHEKRFLADMQFPFGITCSGKEEEICEITTMQIELKEQRVSD